MTEWTQNDTEAVKRLPGRLAKIPPILARFQETRTRGILVSKKKTHRNDLFFKNKNITKTPKTLFYSGNKQATT